MLNFEFYAPTQVIFGVGKLGELGEVVQRYGKRALLVALADMRRFDFLDRIEKELQAVSVDVVLYDGVEPNPTAQAVDKGGEVARREDVNVVIGLGGGSAIDAAKGIAVMASHEANSVWEFVTGTEVATAKTLPIVTIPTTAGTGSEVSRGAVFSNPALLQKDSFGSDYIFPRVAIVDPSLTVTLPPGLTAATGLDALAHAIEGYVSIRANPLGDTLALTAMRLIAKSLRLAVADGESMEARSDMAFAAMLGGLVLSQAGVGAAHALGMILGGRYGTPHGVAVGILLAAVIEQNWQANPAKFAEIARALDQEIDSLPEFEAAERSITAVRDLVADVGLISSLRHFDISARDVPKLAEEARQHPDMAANPRDLTLDEVVWIYEQAL